MVETKKPTAEEIEQKRAEMRESALESLDSSLWNYAAPKLISSENFGKLSQLAQQGYGQILSQSPDKYAWETLFAPQLLSEGGSVNSPYLQTMSARILQESVMSVKVDDVYGLMGASRPLKEDYQGVYMSDLSKEELGAVVGSYMTFKTSEIATGLLEMQKKGIVETLESLLGQEETEDKSE